MRKTINLRFHIRHAVLATLFLVLNHASAEPIWPITVKAVEATAPNRQKSLIIGTVHLAPPGVPQFIPPLDGAKRLVVEGLLTSNTPVLNEMAPGLIADDELAPWAKTLSPAEHATLVDRTKGCQDVDHLLSRQSPNQASIAAWTSCRQAKYYRPDAMAQYIAGQKHIPIEALDTPLARQLAYKAVPPGAFLDSLKVALSKEHDDEYQEAAESIRQGDYDSITRGVFSGFADPIDAVMYQQPLVTGRNYQWLPKLVLMLNEGNAVVVVGAAHLGGEQGILKLLQKRGFQMRLVDVPAFIPN